MTDLEGWEKQGDLLLKVASYDTNDPGHKEAAKMALRGTIETVASVHGASFSEKGLHDTMRLLDEAENDEDSDLILELHFAKWDVCERKPICLGASLGWNTFAFTPEGKLVRARYTEDVCLLKGQLRELIRSRPEGMKFPKESLMAYFERISLREMRDKQGIHYRYGEVAPDNTTMRRQLDANGVDMGASLDSAVLEYDRMPGGLLDHWPEKVKVRPIFWKGVKSKRNFIVRWKDGAHDVRFIVSKGRATAPGVPRIDIRPWDNGNPPDANMLESIVAATLRAIEDETGIEKRAWVLPKRRHKVPSPIIPLLESRIDIFKTLFRMSGEKAVMPDAEASTSFDPPIPPIHVHIIGKKHMIEAFKTVHAQTRFFGDKPMVPGVNIIGKGMKLAA